MYIVHCPYILQDGDRIMLGLKSPEFIFQRQILNSTVLVEVSEEELTILEIPSQENNNDSDHGEIIEEIKENNEDILKPNIEINSAEESRQREDKTVDILEEIKE